MPIVGGDFLNKKVILVTGCSSGFGRAICEQLNSNQYYIVATARNKESLKDLQVDMALSLDVCDEESIQNAINAVIKETGRIDILINNAGFSIRSAMEELDIEKMKSMYEVNVFGLVRMIQAVLPIMRKQNSGRILNVGSISGRMVGIVNGGYCSTKYAVEALTEAVRYEVADRGIEVAVIEPGAMDTNFFKTLSRYSDEQMLDSHSPYNHLYNRDLNYRKKQKKSSVEICAREVVKILEKKKLKTRYTVGVAMIYRLFTHLPDRLKEYGIKKFN